MRSFDPSPDLYVEPQTPIAVNSDQMESVTFGKILVDLPEGEDTVRYVVDGGVVRSYPVVQQKLIFGAPAWARADMDELRSAGYPVLGGENLLFNQDDATKARYIIGGTVKHFLDVYHTSRIQPTGAFTPMECSVDVVWQVFDTNTRQVCLTCEIRGYGMTTGVNKTINQALRSSFRGLLADDAFVQTLRSATSGAAPSTQSAPQALQLTSPSAVALQMPQQIQTVIDAVVTIRVGSVQGSAFFITPDGYLLTAAHVVSGRDTCLVKIGDGRQAEARVWRIDAVADVALLRVAEGKYPALQLNTTARPAVGTEVYTIGTPLTDDLEHTVSRGIVSAERTSAKHDLIQTDATVNFGNSGGPLVDATGKAVGIVSSKAVKTGVSGIAFAIPIETAINRLGLQMTTTTTQPTTAPTK